MGGAWSLNGDEMVLEEGVILAYWGDSPPASADFDIDGKPGVLGVVADGNCAALGV